MMTKLIISSVFAAESLSFGINTPFGGFGISESFADSQSFGGGFGK